MGKGMMGRLEKMKVLGGEMYGVVDVGVGDRGVVGDDFCGREVGKKVKG